MDYENALNNFLSGTAGISIDEKYYDLSIEEMDFSVRSYNCLKRSGIDTIGQLNGMKAEDLMSIKNLGKTSVNEIFEKLMDLNSGSIVMLAAPSTVSVFADKWGVKRYDVSIDDMHFSVRAYNVLNSNGYTSLSQLVDLDEANVVLIRKIIEDYGGTSQDIQDLMYILREGYGITISKSNLAGILENAGMDYDSHTGIVEIDNKRKF